MVASNSGEFSASPSVFGTVVNKICPCFVYVILNVNKNAFLP